jgi:hypothetical protein
MLSAASCVMAAVLLTSVAAADEPPTKTERPVLTWLFTWADKQEDEANKEGEDEEAKEEPLESDRPDFTESSATVGRHRWQVESGYTYTQAKGGDPTDNAHDLPELLVRWGVAERLELRLAWDEGMVFESQRDRGSGRLLTTNGSSDVSFGFKYAISKQKGWRPQTGIIASVSAPIGDAAQGSRQVDAHINYCYSWEFTEKLSLSCSTGNKCTRESDDHFTRFFHSTSVEYELTKKLHVFNEWYGLFRRDANDNRPQYYYDGGFTYLVTPNFQLDWRAGVGLNAVSDGFFTGCGLTIRK